MARYAKNEISEVIPGCYDRNDKNITFYNQLNNSKRNVFLLVK